MSPVYEEAGAWWFDSNDGIMGPYDTEALALESYQRYNRNNCPTCEEQYMKTSHKQNLLLVLLSIAWFIIILICLFHLGES